MSEVDKIYKVFAQRDAAASYSFTLHKGSRFIGNVTFKRTSFIRVTCYLHLFDYGISKAVVDARRSTAQSEAIHSALQKLAAIEDTTNRKWVDKLLIGFNHNKEWIQHFEDKGILVAHIRGIR